MVLCCENFSGRFKQCPQTYTAMGLLERFMSAVIIAVSIIMAVVCLRRDVRVVSILLFVIVSTVSSPPVPVISFAGSFALVSVVSFPT